MNSVIPVAPTVATAARKAFIALTNFQPPGAPTISGSVGAPPNSAVNVNGQLATVSSGGQFFLNDLNLQAGANTVTATVTTADGQTANQVITITRSAIPALFGVSVTPGGIATPTSPFIADISITNPNNTPFATITVVCSDPGPGLDFAAVGTYTCPYGEAGGFDVRVTVKDALGGVIYSGVKRVMVFNPIEQYLFIRGVFYDVEQRLRAGNIASAVSLFVGARRADYTTYFTSLGANLTSIASQLGTIRGATLTDRHSEFTTVRDTLDGPTAFPIHIIRDVDGIWRIESM